MMRGGLAPWSERHAFIVVTEGSFGYYKTLKNLGDSEQPTAKNLRGDAGKPKSTVRTDCATNGVTRGRPI
jgi:hypothetical protein